MQKNILRLAISKPESLSELWIMMTFLTKISLQTLQKTLALLMYKGEAPQQGVVFTNVQARPDQSGL